MKAEHKQLVDQYKKNEKAIEKSQIKTLILEVVMIGIVVYMKSIQATATLRQNIAATSLVLIVLCLHFLYFYPNRALHEKSTQIILDGLEVEKKNPFLKLSFFTDYIKEFSVLGSIIKMALFDIILIYFFSISYTQLVKAINPEALVKLRPITPISTSIINLSLGWAYYRVIRSLIPYKMELKESCVS